MPNHDVNRVGAGRNAHDTVRPAGDGSGNDGRGGRRLHGCCLRGALRAMGQCQRANRKGDRSAWAKRGSQRPRSELRRRLHWKLSVLCFEPRMVSTE
jgi:hypothetical protein